jgi:hypothetical protein
MRPREPARRRWLPKRRSRLQANPTAGATFQTARNNLIQHQAVWKAGGALGRAPACALWLPNTLPVAGFTLWTCRQAMQAIETGIAEFGSVRADGHRVVFRGGASDPPTSIGTLDLRSEQYRILKQVTDLLDRTELRIANYITKVEQVEFPTTGPPAARLRSDCSMRRAIRGGAGPCIDLQRSNRCVLP